MKLGIFGGARQKRGWQTPIVQTSRDWIEYNIEVEALDFCSSFTTEHHFTGLGQVSASLKLMTYFGCKDDDIAPRHRRNAPSLAQPGFVGGTGGDIDLVSDGRLYFGVVMGIAATSSTPSVSTWWMPTRFCGSLALILKSGRPKNGGSTRANIGNSMGSSSNSQLSRTASADLPLPVGPAPSGRRPDGGASSLDQYSPLHAVFERAEIFRDQIRQIGVDPQDRQIALARGLFIAKTRLEKADVIAWRPKARNFVDQLAEKPTATTRPASCNSKDRKRLLTVAHWYPRRDCRAPGGYSARRDRISPAIECGRRGC